MERKRKKCAPICERGGNVCELGNYECGTLYMHALDSIRLARAQVALVRSFVLAPEHLQRQLTEGGAVLEQVECACPHEFSDSLLLLR